MTEFSFSNLVIYVAGAYVALVVLASISGESITIFDHTIEPIDYTKSNKSEGAE